MRSCALTHTVAYSKSCADAFIFRSGFRFKDQIVHFQIFPFHKT